MADGGLEAVFMLHRAALLRFLVARGGSVDAEDLLQELWVKAASASTGPIGEPVGYLYRMADNLMLDRRRSELRRARRDHQWTDASGGATMGVSDQPSAEQALIARERLRTVDRALTGLGERTATIFRRYRIEGISQRDIAAELGVSVSAVEKHLQKAYHALLEVRQTLDADSLAPRRREIEGISDVAR
jgi:RNA polymerase sigma-70 factor (ECF subfamily)